jgi:UDPglucose--hexose-1-phosphate uridylyltransferase
MTFRTHLITGEPILFAPERATRPRAFIHDAPARQRCPFCPGHEDDTPPPLAAVGDPWRVRVVPNKYPSVEGAEVIIESPRHDEEFDRLGNAGEVVAVYVDRYRAHRDATYTAIFKNHGPDGGASIPHLHSQVMPLPFIPPRIEREGNAFMRADECPLCVAIATHRRDGLTIRETDSFAWLAPSASWMTAQQWIVPKQHAPELTSLDDARIEELALLLQAASKATMTIAPSFNWLFLNFPGQPAAHWYIDLFPRLTTIAGFELSTGTFVQIMGSELHFSLSAQVVESTPRSESEK